MCFCRFPSPDCGLVSVGKAGNDGQDQSHQSCDLCQLHPLQHTHWGIMSFSITCNRALESMEVTFVLHLSPCQVKKDPDSPEATPPSTPGSSHSSKPLPQGNGSLDGRARQRKRKKVCVCWLQPLSVDYWFLKFDWCENNIIREFMTQWAVFQ